MQPIRRQALTRRKRCSYVREPDTKWGVGELRVGLPKHPAGAAGAKEPAMRDADTSEHSEDYSPTDPDEILLIRDWKNLVLSHKQLPSPSASP